MSNTTDSFIEVGAPDEDWKEVPVTLHYEYQPEEKAFFNAYEGYGHPGEGHSCELTLVEERLPRDTYGPRRRWEYGDLDLDYWTKLEEYILDDVEMEGD